MDPAEGAPGERSYRYAAKSRWTYLAAAVATGTLAAGAVALQFAPNVDLVERGQLLIFTAAFAAVAVHAAAGARIMAGEVRLSGAGMARNSSPLVPWSDVAGVEIRPLLHRMDVFDASGRRFLSVRPELDAFPAVQSYIVSRMQPRPCTPPCTIPLLSPLAGAPIAMLSALLAVWFGPQRGPGPPLLFAGISAAFALQAVARRRSIEVGSDGIVLKQGWRRFAVPFREISAVHVQAQPRVGGGAVHFVVLERAGADAVPIAGFRLGYNHAYHCIEAAWRAARAHSPPARG